MAKLQVFALLLVAPLMSAETADKCPDGWSSIAPLSRALSLRKDTDPIRLQCVKLFTEETSWYRANAICKGQKAHLLEINSHHEAKEVKKVSPEFSNTGFYWAGGNDLATQNKWVWSSKGYRIYPYVNWKEGRPNGNGRCLGLDARTFEWQEESCDKNSTFYCEMSMTVKELNWKKQLSFDGNGYIKLNHKLIAQTVENDWLVKMTLSTWQPNSLILWQGNNEVSGNFFDSSSGNYMALGIKNGYFSFRSNGKDLVALDASIIDGKSHNISVRKENSKVIITVDSKKSVTGDFANLADANLMESLHDEDFYLGGLPESVDEKTDGYFTSGFAGCIHFLDAHNIELKTGIKYGGSPEEFSKPLANQEFRGVVSSDQCLLPARPTARPTFMPTTMTSTMPRTSPTTTKSTKKPYVKREVAFDGNSFAAFPDGYIPWESLEDSFTSLELTFKLTTQSSSGLLFLQGTVRENFLAVGVMNGRAAVDFNFGSNYPVSLMSQSNINNGREQEITIRINGNEVSLSINQYFEDEKQIYNADFPYGMVHIGGTRNVAQDTGSKYTSKFYGCLKSVAMKVDGSSIPLDFSNDIIPQESSLNSFQCYSLTVPTVPTTPPTTTARTTVMTTTRPPEKCVYDEISLDGTGYVKMSKRYMGTLESSHLELMMNFATRQANGLILWQGNKAYDYFSMGIKNGYLECDISMGSGINLFVRSSSKLDDGSEKKISVVLFNQNVTLFVNGKLDGVDDNNPTKYFEFDTDPLYLGGGPTNILKQSGYNKGFEGCITKLGFMHYKLPGLQGPDSYGSRNMKFSNPGIIEEQMNAKCTKMCRV